MDVLLISTVIVSEAFVRVHVEEATSRRSGRFTEGEPFSKKGQPSRMQIRKREKGGERRAENRGTIRCASMNWETKQFQPGLIQFRFCRISKRNSVYGGAALCIICVCVCAIRHGRRSMLVEIVIGTIRINEDILRPKNTKGRKKNIGFDSFRHIERKGWVMHNNFVIIGEMV